MEYFFHEDLQESNTLVTLTDDTAKHLISVLRKPNGYEFILVNGKGLKAVASLIIQGKKKAEAQVISFEKQAANPNNLNIAVAFTKNTARNEWMVEKLAELGCKKIIPLHAHRSVKTHFRMDRLKSIAVSALCQSQQLWLTEIAEVYTWKDIWKVEATQKMIAHCLPQQNPLKLSDYKTNEPTIVLIGPEGDFTEEEIKEAMGKNFVPITLGPIRLRTETAAMSVAAYMNVIK